MNKEDALRIRDILRLFDYESANLTEDQWAAIEEIEDIVYKPEYDPPKTFLYEQKNASDKWIIKHNFKSVGAVEVLNEDSTPYTAYVSVGHNDGYITLGFPKKFKGKAILVEDDNEKENKDR